ncbi:TPA: hypothetical protein HA246_04650 [Candidatus Woesearchaeota archaeon]|nr:hypothetical protein [Candidatus Woesearchaeota archaeon]
MSIEGERLEVIVQKDTKDILGKDHQPKKGVLVPETSYQIGKPVVSPGSLETEIGLEPGDIVRIKHSHKKIIAATSKNTDVSKKHGWLTYDAGKKRWLYSDSSRNGTLIVNYYKAKKPVQGGEKLSIGEAYFVSNTLHEISKYNVFEATKGSAEKQETALPHYELVKVPFEAKNLEGISTVAVLNPTIERTEIYLAPNPAVLNQPPELSEGDVGIQRFYLDQLDTKTNPYRIVLKAKDETNATTQERKGVGRFIDSVLKVFRIK